MMVQQAVPVVKQIQRSVTSYENHGAFRWNKPAFQAFQLRPWSKDPETEESLKNSLAIYGPQVQSEISRAKSVPIREKDSIIDRDDVRTAHSVANVRDLISLKPKCSLEAMPVRPPLSKTKQIPGRYFPKPTTADTTRVVSFSVFRRYKPPVRARTLATGNSKSLDTSNLPVESVSFMDAIPRSHRQSSPGFSRRIHRPKRLHTELPEIKSEIFTICFNNNGSARRAVEENSSNNSEAAKLVKSSYDPNSELHSDYYTIKRVSVNTPSTSSRGVTSRSFSVVLRGQPKRLHPKIMFLSDSDHHMEGQEKLEPKSTTNSAVGTNSKDHVADGEADQASHRQSITSNGKIKVKIDSGMLPIAVN